MFFLSSLAIAQLLSSSAIAQLPQVDNIIRVHYLQTAWNKNPKEKDTGVIVIRDKSTGRFVQAKLTESAPDSNRFHGRFYISWATISEISPEVYDPPQHMASSREGLVKISEMIEKKEITRKPFILTRDANRAQHLEIFDAKDTARSALDTHRLELVLAAEIQSNDDPTDEQEDLRRQIRENIKKEREQLPAEQIFRQNQEKPIRAFNTLSLKQQQLQKDQAAAIATNGFAAYQSEKFTDAEAAFQQAITLNPTSGEYSYQLGVVLYRQNKFSEALIRLRASEGPNVNLAERDYFVGLTLYQMKQRYNAARTFHNVQLMNNESISPTAAFYEGLIYMELRDYNRAKKAFQTVLDTSNDPKLDANAEAYIEQISQIQAFEAEKKKKFFLTGLLGLMYDSNVLTVSDASRTTTLATNTEGYRNLFSGTVEWRPIYASQDEVAARVNLTGMYTVASDFEERRTLAQADPLLISVTGLYRRKGSILGIPIRSELAPGYERIMMAVEEQRDTTIIESYVAKWNNMLIAGERLIFMPTLELRQDTSLLLSAVGDSDSSATKYSLAWSSLYLMGDEKNRTLGLDLGYSNNMAAGKNYIFQRKDLAISFGHPGFMSTTWSWRAAYFQSYYSDLATPRTENNYSVSSTILRPLTPNLTGTSAVAYTQNQSNDDTRKYNKFTFMLSLIAQGVF